MSSKPPPPEEIGDRLARLANHLMDRILDAENGEELPIDEETSAFKAITNYYAILKKLNPPNREDRAFNGWQDEVSGIGRGGSEAGDEHSEGSTGNHEF
jgi:hypothetical protein